MSLTPLEIRKQDFPRGFRGFEPEEVHRFLSLVASEFETMLEEHRRLQSQIEELRAKMEHYQKVEEALQEALNAARENALRTTRQAEEKADIIVEQAEVKARKLIDEADQQSRSIVEDADARRRSAEEVSRSSVDEIEGEKKKIKQEVTRLSDHRSEILARLRGFLLSEMEVLARYEEDDPIGFIKLLPADKERETGASEPQDDEPEKDSDSVIITPPAMPDDQEADGSLDEEIGTALSSVFEFDAEPVSEESAGEEAGSAILTEEPAEPEMDEAAGSELEDVASLGEVQTSDDQPVTSDSPLFEMPDESLGSENEDSDESVDLGLEPILSESTLHLESESNESLEDSIATEESEEVEDTLPPEAGQADRSEPIFGLDLESEDPPEEGAGSDDHVSLVVESDDNADELVIGLQSERDDAEDEQVFIQESFSPVQTELDGEGFVSTDDMMDDAAEVGSETGIRAADEDTFEQDESDEDDSEDSEEMKKIRRILKDLS